MYFCPWSPCSQPDPESGEEDTVICLPRNLSYVGESYLDRYSVSSRFVHNPQIEKQFIQADVEDKYKCLGANTAAECEKLLESKDEEPLGVESSTITCQTQEVVSSSSYDMDKTELPVVFSNGMELEVSRTLTCQLPPSPCIQIPSPKRLLTKTEDAMTVISDLSNHHDNKHEENCVHKTVGSPDSDLVSEEGIFINMMDDLDGFESTNCKSTASEVSDECVSGDSMFYSPEEAESLCEDETRREGILSSLEEAVSQAAIDIAETNINQLDADVNQLEANVIEDANVTQLNVNADESAAANTKQLDTNGNGIVFKECDSKVERSRVGQLASKITGLKIHLNDNPFSDCDGASCSILDLVSAESPIYEDQEFNFRKSDLRKSASLKSAKTPPGTPRRKKVVRFADAMGLDLESVRHIMNLESPPKIPSSAMADLQLGLSLDRREMGTKFLTACFEQPGASDLFLQRVMADKVCLENVVAVSGNTITGVVRVANIAYHKFVYVRFSTDGWTSFHNIAATYVLNSNDGPTDRFSFTIVAPTDLVPGCRLEFAVLYNANGCDYWDSNHGNNYVFECFAKTVPVEAEGSWMHFL